MSICEKVRFISMALIMTGLVSLTACKPQPITESAQPSGIITMKAESKSSSSLLPFHSNHDIKDWVDPDTGVHYLVYSDQSGYAGMGGITPRLNPDGSVMVDEK